MPTAASSRQRGSGLILSASLAHQPTSPGMPISLVAGALGREGCPPPDAGSSQAGVGGPGASGPLAGLSGSTQVGGAALELCHAGSLATLPGSPTRTHPFLESPTSGPPLGTQGGGPGLWVGGVKDLWFGARAALA